MNEETKPMDAETLANYRAGASLPGQAIEGLTAADLRAHPVPGTWSIQEIVFHLMDSDLIASDRMKRVIAEDNPVLIGYNETKFAQNLPYDRLDTQMACEVFRLNRLLTATILESLPPQTFQRVGQHNEVGAVTLEKLVRTYTDHLTYHLKFVQEKRKLLGKSA